jgi:hypothetical protein
VHNLHSQGNQSRCVIRLKPQLASLVGGFILFMFPPLLGRMVQMNYYELLVGGFELLEHFTGMIYS